MAKQQRPEPGQQPDQPWVEIGGMVGPTDVPSLEQDLDTRVRAQGRTWAQPNWDAAQTDTPAMPPAPTAGSVATGAPPIADPVELAQWHGQQEMSVLSQFDQQLAEIQAPIQAQLDVSKQQYSVDFDTITNSNMPIDQKERRLQDLNAQYQKKWIGIKGKTQLEEQAIRQQKQQAAFQLQLQQTLRMQKIQQYAQMAQDGYIDDATALRLQYRTMGYEVPATFGQPEKTQTPYKQLQQNTQHIESLTEYLNLFQVQKAKDRPFKRWDRPRRVMIKDPTQENPDAVREATSEEVDQMQGALERITVLRRQNHTLSQQFVTQQVPDLMSGVDPLSTGIKAEKPKRPAPVPAVTEDMSTWSAEELLKLVGGQ